MWLIVWMRYAVFGIVAILCGASFIYIIFKQIRALAQTVSISDSTIRARSFLGKEVAMHWGDISELQEFTTPTVSGPAKVIRLVSRDSLCEIVFNARIVGFEELRGEIHTRATTARVQQKTSSWQHFLWEM
jgi:hypothetical protein